MSKFLEIPLDRADMNPEGRRLEFQGRLLDECLTKTRRLDSRHRKWLIGLLLEEMKPRHVADVAADAARELAGRTRNCN